LTAVLAEARAELAAAARAGRAEGASIRAIAEAVGLSRPRVHEMLNATTEPLQAVGPMDVGPTCG
jgi:DNA-binding IclR family transcriptional regulator